MPGRLSRAESLAIRDGEPRIACADAPPALKLSREAALALKLRCAALMRRADFTRTVRKPIGVVPAGAVARALLLAWVGYTAIRHLADPEYFSLLSGVTFGAHEFGHLAFAPFGETLAVAGGSLMQILVPIGAAALIAARGDRVGVAFAACWLAISMVDLARYVADARALELPLVSMSPDGGDHDWNWLLDRYGVLAYDLRIAAALRRGAAVVLLVALAAGAWSCLQDLVTRPATSPSSE